MSPRARDYMFVFNKLSRHSLITQEYVSLLSIRRSTSSYPHSRGYLTSMSQHRVATSKLSSQPKPTYQTSRLVTMTALEDQDLEGLNGPTAMKPASDIKEINAWSGPGQAAFDFRSKIIHSISWYFHCQNVAALLFYLCYILQE